MTGENQLKDAKVGELNKIKIYYVPKTGKENKMQGTDCIFIKRAFHERDKNKFVKLK